MKATHTATGPTVREKVITWIAFGLMLFGLFFARESLARLWKLAVAYCFAVILAHWPIKLVTEEWWRKLGAQAEGERFLPWRPRAVGLVERALYVASWQVGYPQFVAVWLALKVAGQWKARTVRRGANSIPERTLYNQFLVGNALSISYGSVGGLMIRWMDSGNWPLAVLMPGVVTVATLVLYWWTLAQPDAGEAEPASREVDTVSRD